MASTYTFDDALKVLSTTIPKANESAIATIALNQAIELIWDAYPWRESLVPLPPFWLVENKQDYGSPLGVIPTNFRSLEKAWAVDTTSFPYRVIPLDVIGNLDKTDYQGFPNAVGYIPEIQAFRVHPNVSYGHGGSRFLVEGVYKKSPTKINPGTFSSFLPWDDRYFYVFLAALRWAFMGEGREKNQAMREVLFLVDEMAVKENISNGAQNVIAPRDPLVTF